MFGSEEVIFRCLPEKDAEEERVSDETAALVSVAVRGRGGK